MEDDLRSAHTHTKAWSPWQPALRVPGDPRVEEVRPRGQGAKLRIQAEVRVHTHMGSSSVFYRK